MITIRKSFLSIIILLFSLAAFSQNATIKGFVYDKSNGEPVLFTNVFLLGTQIGASTDVNGFYAIGNVPAGSHTLTVTAVGFDKLSIPITIKENEVINKKLYLIKSNVQLEEVEISANKQDAQNNVRVGLTKITPKDIQQIPTIGGEADIAQYLQVLPGVVSTGDQGGQLYIRGGEPVQNLVMLDGMTIYNPFHSIGLFSVFDTDILRSADVYTAGFNAEYGGRVSSVMDLKTRDGNKKRIAGKISSGPFMSKVMVEGPLSKQTDEDKGSSSFLLSTKTSYLKQSSPVLYKYVDKTAEVPIPYNFTDIYGKVSLYGGNGSKLNLFGFNFIDSALFKQSNVGWNSRGFGSSFVIVPGNSPLLMDGIVAYSNYDITQKEVAHYPRNANITGYTAGLNFTLFFPKDEVKYGVNVQIYDTKYNFYTTLGQPIAVEGTTTEGVAYVKYKMIFPKLILEPGLHSRYYVKLNEFTFEPRIGAKYNLTYFFRLKAAGGYYSQNLINSNYSRVDVVNLFNGYITGPENVPNTFNGEDRTASRLQKARHAVVGMEYDLTAHIEAGVEAYYKDFYQLTSINREKLYPTDYDFVYEQGQAKGIDFSLKYEKKRLYIWTVYSLGMVNRQFEQTNTGTGLYDYHPVFDRRHNFSIVTSYSFGKNKQWEVDTRWNYGSGFPFTPQSGFYPKQSFDGGANTDYTKADQSLATIYGALNSKRLSVYHRMDVSVKRRFALRKNTELEIVASATNVYSNRNIFYFDRITNARIYQLPILPTLSASLSF